MPFKTNTICNSRQIHSFLQCFRLLWSATITDQFPNKYIMQFKTNTLCCPIQILSYNAFVGCGVQLSQIHFLPHFSAFSFFLTLSLLSFPNFLSRIFYVSPFSFLHIYFSFWISHFPSHFSAFLTQSSFSFSVFLFFVGFLDCQKQWASLGVKFWGKRKSGGPEVEKLPSVKVLESPKAMSISWSEILRKKQEHKVS